MTDLIECIREIIERHRVQDVTATAGDSCRCGAGELADHSRHVAQEVVAWQRYLYACFDDELTKFEGAE
jgi:hypothetical protein